MISAVLSSVRLNQGGNGERDLVAIDHVSHINSLERGILVVLDLGFLTFSLKTFT